jgi:thiol-disulfide isomerase/thioredoxin
LAAAVCLGLAGTVRAEDPAELLQPGVEAPTFSLPTLTGQREALSVYCGKQLSKPYANSIHHIVILSFWATYCKPCQKEMPELSAFMKKHAGDSIKLYCVSIDKEGASIVAPFVKEKKYDTEVLLDPYKAVARKYGVKTLPSLFVIGGDGVVRYSTSGFEENTNLVARLDEIVASIRSGKVVSQKGGEGKGASVAVKDDNPEVPEAKAVATSITAKEKWNAVARKETGEPVERIAAEMGVTVNEVNGWYGELKKAAIGMWGGAAK